MSHVLEEGDIQFWFRPSVQPADAEQVTRLGVQSFFAVLSPAGSDLHRRLRIGKKRMPASSHDRFWARVERVGSLQRTLGDVTEAETYSTKTRGERYQPGARPIASGTYRFTREDDHVRLAYHLEQREDDPDLPQVDDASHLVLFEAAPEDSAVWTTDGDPHLLDFEDAEIVLVGAKSGEHAA